MSETELKEYTYAEVKEHASKKDLWMVIHDKIYDIASFVDEHPGGEEVLLDVGGMDATDSFEDVGHSDEAREVLEPLLVGKVVRGPGDPKPKTPAPGATSASNAGQGGADAGTAMYAFFFVAALVAFGAWKYLQQEGVAQVQL